MTHQDDAGTIAAFGELLQRMARRVNAATAGPRCICGDPIEQLDETDPSSWIHSPGSDTPCTDARPAIRCNTAFVLGHLHAPHHWQPQPGMEPVRCPGGSGRAAPADGEDAQRAVRRDSLHNLLARLERTQLHGDEISLLRQHVEAEISEYDTMRAVAAGNKRHVQTIIPEIDRLSDELERATARIERVRALASRWAVLRTHGSAATELRGALDGTEPQPPTEREDSVKAQQADTAPVKEATRRYAEQLRAAPGTVVADGHAGWECDAGASLIVEASTPGPGKLGTHHGVIYACAAHRATAVERITSGGYEVDPRPAPPGHRWNPWPCGHVTAHDADVLAVLTAAGARQDGGAS